MSWKVRLKRARELSESVSDDDMRAHRAAIVAVHKLTGVPILEVCAAMLSGATGVSSEEALGFLRERGRALKLKRKGIEDFAMTMSGIVTLGVPAPQGRKP